MKRESTHRGVESPVNKQSPSTPLAKNCADIAVGSGSLQPRRQQQGKGNAVITWKRPKWERRYRSDAARFLWPKKDVCEIEWVIGQRCA
jgi:hypothetical protein